MLILVKSPEEARTWRRRYGLRPEYRHSAVMRDLFQHVAIRHIMPDDLEFIEAITRQKYKLVKEA